MIINKLLMELGKAGIPCKFVGAQDEMVDDSINILNHPLDLHIQLTPYDKSPFQIGHWTTAAKTHMKFIPFTSVKAIIDAIKELCQKEVKKSI